MRPVAWPRGPDQDSGNALLICRQCHLTDEGNCRPDRGRFLLAPGLYSAIRLISPTGLVHPWHSALQWLLLSSALHGLPLYFPSYWTSGPSIHQSPCSPCPLFPSYPPPPFCPARTCLIFEGLLQDHHLQEAPLPTSCLFSPYIAYLIEREADSFLR